LENDKTLAIKTNDEIKSEFRKLGQLQQKEEYLVVIAFKEQFNEKDLELL
jgi:hypothetical protein